MIWTDYSEYGIHTILFNMSYQHPYIHLSKQIEKRQKMKQF